MPTEAMQITGLGRNSVLELIADGSLRSVKLAGRRLVVIDSIHELIEHHEAIPYAKTKKAAPKHPGRRRLEASP
jgi:hypothetical protein